MPNSFNKSILLFVVFPFFVGAAEPPLYPPVVPLGFKELEETGNYIKQFEIGEDDGRSYKNQGIYDPTPVVIKNWHENKNATLLHARFDKSERGHARLVVFDMKPYGIKESVYTGKAWHQAGRHTTKRINSVSSSGFLVADRDVVPILGELYAAELVESRKVVRLTRVTESIPEVLRPRHEKPSRTIPLTSIDARMFVEPVAGRADAEIYDHVRLLRIDSKTRHARIHLVPDVTQWASIDGIPHVERKPLGGEISPGEILAPPGRTHGYKVLNIVAPERIEGVGRLVGWIELSAEPFTPTEKDKVSSLHVMQDLPVSGSQ